MLLGSNDNEILELRNVIEPEVAKNMAEKILQMRNLKKLENIIEKLSKTEDSKICASLDKDYLFQYLH